MNNNFRNWFLINNNQILSMYPNYKSCLAHNHLNERKVCISILKTNALIRHQRFKWNLLSAFYNYDGVSRDMARNNWSKMVTTTYPIQQHFNYQNTMKEPSFQMRYINILCLTIHLLLFRIQHNKLRIWTIVKDKIIYFNISTGFITSYK